MDNNTMMGNKNTYVDVPLPEEKKEEQKVVMPDFEHLTAEDIYKEIVGNDDEGYSRSAIIVNLEKIHNVLAHPDEVTEDDHEPVRESNIEYCKVAMQQLDPTVMVVNLIFDQPGDAYLNEINNIYNQYRVMMEKAAELFNKDSNVPLPNITLTFVPLIYEGFATAAFKKPLAFFKTMDEADESCIFTAIFYMKDVDYEVADVSEEEYIELQADYLREQQRKRAMANQ